jgi:hypothetical protein
LNELIEVSQSINDDEMKGRALSLDVYVSAELGQRARLDRSLAALTDLGKVRQRLHVQWAARHGTAMLAILDGDFAAAQSLAAEALELGRLTHSSQVEGAYGIQMFSIRREQGRLAEVTPVITVSSGRSPADHSARSLQSDRLATFTLDPRPMTA